jgi:hypothetical protein
MSVATMDVFALFPTPVARISACLAPHEAQALAARLAPASTVANIRSAHLAHSRILGPGEDTGLDAVVERIGPHLQAFGSRLFGEPLRWLVKEMWVNVLQHGGSQSLHNHANCFVSGVLYLSECDDSARTVFSRALGANEFVFRNTRAETSAGEFGADKWIAPAPQAGDLLLFPSYLLHEVPANQGGQRISLAFNAIPEHLNAWGYSVSFAP